MYSFNFSANRKSQIANPKSKNRIPAAGRHPPYGKTTFPGLRRVTTGAALTALSLVVILSLLVGAARADSGAPPASFTAYTKGFQSDSFTGMASFSYPIETLPGGPALSLNYSSGAVDEKTPREQANWVGLGWSLSGLGSIRKDQDNKFYLSAAGISSVLTELTPGGGEYRTQIESFIKLVHVTSPTDYWWLKTQDGTEYRFGQDMVAGQNPLSDWQYDGVSAERNPAGNFREWLLDQVQDINGNTTLIRYIAYYNDYKYKCNCSSGCSYVDYTREVYPKDIVWNYRGASLTKVGHERKVTFNFGTYPNRTDYDNVSCDLGEYSSRRKLESIDVWFDLNDNGGQTPDAGELVRRYELAYDYGTDTDTTRSWTGGAAGDLTLKSVTVKGTDGATALPAMIFSYTTNHLSSVDNNGLGGSSQVAYAEIPGNQATQAGLTVRAGGGEGYDNCSNHSILNGPWENAIVGDQEVFANQYWAAEFSVQAWSCGLFNSIGEVGIRKFRVYLTDGVNDVFVYGNDQFDNSYDGNAYFGGAMKLVRRNDGKMDVYVDGAVVNRISYPYTVAKLKLYVYSSGFTGSNYTGFHTGYTRLTTGAVTASYKGHYVATSTTSNDGLGGTRTTSYAYTTPYFSYGPYSSFSGFEKVTVTDPAGNKTITHYYQGDGTPAGDTEAWKGKVNYSLAGDGSLTEAVDSHLYAKTVNTYQADSSAPYFAPVTQVDTYAYEGTTTPKQSRVLYTYDAYGNVLTASNQGEVCTGGCTGDESTTTNEYINDTSLWMLGKLKHTYTCGYTNGSQYKSREAWNYYDNAAYGSLGTGANKGNLTKTEAWNSTPAAGCSGTATPPGTGVINTFEYDAYGNVTKTKDGRVNAGEYTGYTSQIAYDTTYLAYVKVITDAKGFVTSTGYDSLMRPTSVTDPNSQVTSTEYDALSRVTKVIKPGDSSTYPTVKYTYTLDGVAPEQVLAEAREQAGTANVLQSYSIVDGLGRTIRTKSEAQTAGQWVTVDTDYDGRGLVRSQSVPYISTAAGYPGGSVLAGAWRLDEGTGAAAGDNSGNGNTGTVNGPAWVAGKIGNGLSFDGADDYVTIPDAASLDVSTEATFAAWVYPRSMTSHRSVFQKVNGDGDASYMLYVGTGVEIVGKRTFRPHIMTSSGWRYGAINFDVPENNWYFVVYTYKASAGEMKAYINGVEYPIVFTSAPVAGEAIRVGTAPLLLGKDTRGFSWFNGVLDEVRIYNRALSADEVNALYVKGGVHAEGVLAGAWRLDEGTGVTATDSSGNGNTATSVNSPTWADGKVGKALSFNGVDKYATVSDSPSLRPQSLSVELWVKPLGLNSNASYQTILAKYTWWGPYSIIWEAYANTSATVGFSASESYATAQRVWSGSNISVGNWYHLAMTCDSSGLKGYINGELVASSSSPCKVNTTDTNPLYIGRQDGGYFFNGVIDEVRIYNRALSADEIKARYNLGSGTSSTYDALGRATQTTYPDGTTSTVAYAPWQVTAKDALNRQKVTTYNAYGQPATVKEYTGTGTYTLLATTQYKYNTSTGELVKITDQKGNIWTTTYDTLGRKTQSVDPDMGGPTYSWAYTYDANGNLITQTDAKGQVMWFRYDALNRVLEKRQTNSSGTLLAAYTYDNSGAGSYYKGRLYQVVAGSFTRRWTYDTRGRTVTEKLLGDSKTWLTSYAYDSMDRVTSVTYPGGNAGQAGEVVNNTYNVQGLPATVAGTSTYLSSANYNAFGRIADMTFGNSVKTTYDYYDTSGEQDPVALAYYSYRLKNILVKNSGGSGTTLLNLTYKYDKVGNVKNVDDGLDATKNQTFTYDDLNRLLSASTTATGYYGSKTYTYNEIGNLLTKDGKTYTYSGNTHRVIATSDGWYYCYDNNGNRIKRGTGGSTCPTLDRTYEYTYDNMLTAVKNSAGTALETNTYDQAGTRIKRVEGSVTTYYVNQYYEEENGVALKHYFANGQRIATRDGAGLKFSHTDHLGSASRTSDTSSPANLIRTIRYDPWGESNSAWGSGTAVVKYTYTGKERDSSTGMYYYGARYYDPVLGRFTTPDSLVPNLYDPQMLNRYSYVRNNPVRMNDPDGRAPVDVSVGYGEAEISDDGFKLPIPGVGYVSMGAGGKYGLSAKLPGGIGGKIGANEKDGSWSLGGNTGIFGMSVGSKGESMNIGPFEFERTITMRDSPHTGGEATFAVKLNLELPLGGDEGLPNVAIGKSVTLWESTAKIPDYAYVNPLHSGTSQLSPEYQLYREEEAARNAPSITIDYSKVNPWELPHYCDECTITSQDAFNGISYSNFDPNNLWGNGYWNNFGLTTVNSSTSNTSRSSSGGSSGSGSSGTHYDPNCSNCGGPGDPRTPASK